MKKFFIHTMVYALSMSVPIFGTDIPPANGTSLPDVLKIAEENNPEIIAARQSWRASQALVSPARTWPYPTFSYVDEKFPSGIENVAPMPVKHYRVEQMVPFPGKLSGESGMKYHESLIAEANFQAKVLDVLGETRMRYYQLYLTDEKIALAEQSVGTLRGVLHTAQARLASGHSTTSDVLTAQIELRKMENQLFQAQQQRTLAQIELNTLLNQPTTTSWGAARPPELSELPLELGEFQQLARNNAPQYWAAMHEINHAKAMLARNRLEFAPDFGFMYERETGAAGPAGRQIGVSVSFPLWLQRPWDLYKGAKEHMAETQAMSRGTENTIMKMVHAEFTETNTYLTLARNYQRDILPAAESNLKIAREQYASGRGDFLRVLEAFRGWIDAHNEYQEQVYGYGEHASVLEKWVGVRLADAKKVLAEQSSQSKGNRHAH